MRPVAIIETKYQQRKTGPVQIPPTQLLDRSYSAYTSARRGPVQIPPKRLVDRSYFAYTGARVAVTRALAAAKFNNLAVAHQLRWWDLGSWPRRPFCRPGINNPPTSLVGFEGANPSESSLQFRELLDFPSAVADLFGAHADAVKQRKIQIGDRRARLIHDVPSGFEAAIAAARK